MIYTLTPNPAIDMNISSVGLHSKQVNRTFGSVYSPNGKGLNVSYVLQHFGIKSGVVGFFGGFSGKYIVEETEKRGLTCHPVWVDEPTRINVFLNNEERGEEYKLVNEGSFVSKEKQQEMLNLLANLSQMTTLVVSGSLPKGVEPQFYDQLFNLLKEKGVKMIIDSSSPHLKNLLAYQPFLIKPNDEELKAIFNLETHTDQEVKEAMQFLHQQGSKNILLTLGDKGSYFYNGQTLYKAGTKKVMLESSACAGDATLAAFLSFYLENTDDTTIEKALKRANATGANVAESKGLGSMDKIEDYAREILVKKID